MYNIKKKKWNFIKVCDLKHFGSVHTLTLLYTTFNV